MIYCSWPDRVSFRKGSLKPINMILASFEVLYFLMALVEFPICWKSSSAFYAWLNNWNEIDFEIADSVSNLPYNAEQFSKFASTFMKLYIGVPTIVFGIITTSVSWNDGTFVWTIVSFFLNLGSTLLLHSEDTKTILMLKSVDIAFDSVSY